MADDRAARLALDLIREADPPTQATIEVSGELSLDAIQKMSLSQLMAVAETYQIDLSRDDQGAIEVAKTPPAPPELGQPGEPEAE